MIKHTIKHIILALCIAVSGSSLTHTAQEPIPAQVMHYLHKHEVEPELKERLDHFFDNPDTYELLNSLYLKPMQVSDEAFAALAQEKGFYFYRKNVFTHQDFPGHIFKFGYTQASEYQNISRIRMAEIIRHAAKERHLDITTPNKQVYFPSSKNYNFPLRAVIVAEKWNLDSAQELTEKQVTDCEELEKTLKLPDLQIGMGTNVIGFGPNKPVGVIDTEPIDIELHYPAIQEREES